MPVTDFLLDETGDLAVSLDGDLVVGESDSQHLADLLVSVKGEWKQWPLVGVGLLLYLMDDASDTELKHEIDTQAAYDGARLTLNSPQKKKVNGYYGT